MKKHIAFAVTTGGSPTAKGSPLPISRSKPAPKADSVAHDIRQSILAGHLMPGERLPSQPDLEKRYAVSCHTLQKAIDVLREDGFIVTRGRNGRLVSSRPPHLHRYGLVFPGRLSAKWSRFYTTLQQLALAIRDDEQRQIDSYYYEPGNTQSADYRTLLRDVLRRRVAGLVFVSRPDIPDDSPVLTQTAIPRVGITGEPHTFPSVMPDPLSFWSRALEYCKRQGRKKVGLLANHGAIGGWKQAESCIRRANVETRSYWTLFFTGPATVTNPVELLMRLPADKRPNALIISDDNLAEAALAGVVASGIKVPREVEIVMHCNFPNPPPGIMPVRRLGYDCRQLLHTCCEVIDRQRRGEPVPSQVLLKAMFEEELPW